MTALVLSPHNDDCELFCAFSALDTQAHVIVVLRSQVQQDRYGITALTREAETVEAMRELDLNYEQWDFLDRDPDWSEVLDAMYGLAEHEWDPVFAPAVEVDGHEHHDRVGEMALEVFGPDRVTSYLTYTRTGGRSRNGVEIVPEPDWIERKHRALACYRSQIAEPSCRPWFMGDLREYVVE